MTKNTEVPSATGPMENTVYSLSSAKPVMVAPDYLGYGITAGEDHPYIAPDIMARHCVDMFYAAPRRPNSASLQFLHLFRKNPLSNQKIPL